jgi:hypothetical protein
MKTAPNQNAFETAVGHQASGHHTIAKFAGTDNPRHLRAIQALLNRPVPREHGDRAVGCSNFPDVVAELRRRGLDIPCERVPDRDRDGLPIKRGVYHFVASDRQKVFRWLKTRRRMKVGAGDTALLFGETP